MLLKHTHKSLLKKIEDIAGLKNMPLSERLKHSNFTYDFDQAMLDNKTRAIQILQYLEADENGSKQSSQHLLLRTFLRQKLL